MFSVVSFTVFLGLLPLGLANDPCLLVLAAAELFGVWDCKGVANLIFKTILVVDYNFTIDLVGDLTRVAWTSCDFDFLVWFFAPFCC